MWWLCCRRFREDENIKANRENGVIKICKSRMTLNGIISPSLTPALKGDPRANSFKAGVKTIRNNF